MAKRRYKHTLAFFTDGRFKSWRAYNAFVRVHNGGVHNPAAQIKDAVTLYVKFPERWRARYGMLALSDLIAMWRK